MTGTDVSGSPGDPSQAPLTLELLADLHAGVFDEPLATQLHRRVAADSRAAAVLTALDATVAEVATLPHQRTASIPEGVARRLNTALAAERAGTGPPLDADWASAASPALVADMTSAVRKRRRAGWAGVAILAVAAAATGVVALSGVMPDSTGAPLPENALDSAIGIQAAEPQVLPDGNPASLHNALDQALQAQDYGPLASPERLRSCLTAHGGDAPLGALQVTYAGRRGVLLVLPTDRPAQLRLLVVGPNCNPADPSRIADHFLTR
ncbi:MAG: hypothetical protein ACRDTG_01230 [Pseudonocardiaceae bacterium]